MKVTLDLYATVALALFFFYIGSIIKNHLKFLRKFCIPTHVVGGILFAVINLIFHQYNILHLKLDAVFQNLCMVAFFTSIGYSASMKTVRKAGKPIILLTVSTAILITMQNIIGGYTAVALGLPKLLGLCLGSIPLVGGHGNAGAFGPQIQSMGINSATTVAIAGATFGLVFGSLLGGPAADFLIRKFKLSGTNVVEKTLEVENEGEGSTDELKISEKEFISHVMLMAFHIFISMAFGVVLNVLIKRSTGITIPVFLCSMLVAVVIRNISDYTHLYPTYEREGNIAGSISLNIFLALAMMSVELWQLIDLAVPMAIILLVQVITTTAYVVLVTFPLMGKDYEAAVMCAAQIGYGFGATPNAMMNIATVEEKYSPAPQSRLVVPFVGGLFTSLINAALITTFINLFA